MPGHLDRNGTIHPGPVSACPICKQADNQQRYRKAANAGTYSTHWRNLRQQRLALDGHQCQLQLPGCTQHADTVHLNPELGRNHHIATLGTCRSACRHCHGVADAPRARRRRR